MRAAVMSASRRALNWLCMATVGGLMCGASAQAQARADASILYFETLNVAPLTSSGAFKTGTPGFSFDAYGRHFDLQLEANDRIASPDVLAKSGSLRLLRGSLKNAPGSWVRMSSVDGTLRGMIWDGAQLFLIEPSNAVRDSLVPPLIATAGETVIFRLADTLFDSGMSICESPAADQPMSGQQAYDSMLKEMKTHLQGMQAASASKRLEISTLGDASFRAQYSSDAQASNEILIRVNNLDGIYSTQLNVAIQSPSIGVTAAATAALSDSTDASALLVSLKDLRKNSSELNSRGLTHLFTGRDLDGSTVGIAYRDALCRTEFGVGLTETRGRGSWVESLIAAHEIGHNFGAVHDGETPTESGEPDCSSTAANQYLMSSSVDQDRSTFSQCSINTMQPKIQAARCITALAPADLSIASDLGTIHKGVARSFDVLVPITNLGGVTAVGTHAQLLVPPSLLVEDVFVAGGTCTSGAGSISCDLGDMPGGVTRTISLTLKSNSVGSNSFSARISATGETLTTNNSGEGNIVIDPEADLAIELQAPSTGAANTGFSTSFTVTNLATIAADALIIDIDLPSGASATAASLTGGTCAIQATRVRCSVTALAAKGTVSGSASLNAQTAGSLRLVARVSGGYVDPNTGNDSAERTIVVVAEAIPPTSPGATATPPKKGGGGSTGSLTLLSLVLLAAARAGVVKRP